MPFQMVMCNARSGDAFVVRAGPAARPWTAVIDTGPPGTADDSIVPALRHVHASTVDLVAVTHIDDDHIGGAPALINLHRHGTFAIGSVWHNSFRALTGDLKISSSANLIAATQRTAAANTQLKNRDDTLALVASVTQGVELARLLADNGLDGNVPFGGLITSSSGIAEWDDAAKIMVLAPSQQQVENLRRHWNKNVNQQLAAERAALHAAASLDSSVTNLASLVFLLDTDGRTVLFTGDARGDHVVTALRDAGLLRNGPLHVDALKIPHHGSARSCTQDLFDHVAADHYLVSGNGTHGNPSAETARRLGRSLRGRTATVWLSHDVDGVTSEFRRLPNVNVEVGNEVGIAVDI